jgi:hypothetical protein
MRQLNAPPYNLGHPEEAEHMAFLIGINVAGM